MRLLSSLSSSSWPSAYGPAYSYSNATLLVGSLVLLSCHMVQSLTTYPLVPHHVQRMRRQRERALLYGTEDTSFSLSSPLASEGSLRRRTVVQQVGALYQGYGTHYVDLWCGSPPQRQTVIVDTGSGITAFPCSGCLDCGAPKYHIDQLFVEADSSTFHANSCTDSCMSSRAHCKGEQCRITMSYAEGSRWNAYEATDSCYIGGPHDHPLLADEGTEDIDPNHASNFAFDLVFGCQNSVTGLFKTQLADGIMGMNNRIEAFWGQMFEAGKMGAALQFSLCFARQPTAERNGTEAGALSLGGTDDRLDLTPMVYTSNASGGRAGFFSVQVRRIWLRDGSAGESSGSNEIDPSVGTKELELSETVMNKGGIIVDSGTTDTYWNRGIANAFQAVFKEMTGRSHSNNPLSLTEEELLALPTILFQLQTSEDANPDLDAYKTVGLAGSLDPQHPTDMLLAFPPTHYMEYDDNTNLYTSRFYPTEGGGSVLGANAMMGHNILFDAEYNRIGWAESNCDYTHLLTDHGYDFSVTGGLETSPTRQTGSPTDPPVALPTDPPVEAPATEAVPTDAPVAKVIEPSLSPVVPTEPNDEASDQGKLKQTYNDFFEVCDGLECQYPVIAFLVIALCLGAFLSYIFSCCCCGLCDRDSRLESESEDYKYSVAAKADDGLEMLNGRSYREASSDDDCADDDKFQDEPVSSGKPNNGSSSNPRKPEFQGDFH